MKLILPEKINAVCFTGHRDLGESETAVISERLAKLLNILAEKHGLTECYAGGAIGLDTIAALEVIRLKMKHPHIKLNLILPCQGQEKSWNDAQKAVYNQIKSQADSVRVLAPFFYNGCMQARNRELLRSSELCIAYLRNGTSGGGSLNTVIQASKLGVPVINLAEQESEYIE